MGNHHNPPRSSARRLPRISFTSVIVTIAVLVIGTVTVVSRQKLSTHATPPKSAQDSQLSAARQPNGHVHYKTQDGQIVELSAEQSEQLAGGLKQLINQSTEDLVEVHHADGSVSVNLEDHFQNVTVARIDRNGSVSQACVDNPAAAGTFFGIDPKLIENAPKRPATSGRSDDR